MSPFDPQAAFEPHEEQWDILSTELLKWNRTHNLTGQKTREGVLLDLILDSLHLGPLINGDTLLDIGSGAGFPGLPLAVAFPHLEITSLEPRAKRVSFQRHIARRLGLESRFRVVSARAGAGEDFTGSFDAVTVRALGPLHDSLNLARPYVTPGGKILLPRGIKDYDAALELGMDVFTYQLPQPYGERLIATL